MDAIELKALQDQITLEQKKQSEAIEALKTAHTSTVDGLVKKIDKYEADIKTLSEQADAIQLELKDKSKLGTVENPFSEMKKAMTDKSVLATMRKGGQQTFEVKASTIDELTELSNGTTNLSTAVIVPMREPGVGKAPDRKVTLLDMVQRSGINSNRISWVERTARTEGTSTLAAAAIAENTSFVQSDFTWAQKFAPVEKIGTYIKITNEALEDWDQVLSEIQNELFPMVERALELSVYQGTGTSPQMQGIIDVCDAYTNTDLWGKIITPNHFDALRAMVMQLALANYTPNAIFLNPVDTASMDMPKNADGIYLMPPFRSLDGRTVAGVKIVESNMVAAGYALVGDFTKDTLFTKRGIEIKIWDQEASDAIYDLKTITASVRAVNRIKLPDYSAFVYDAIGDVVTAITV
jgi:HK97 family phage major capsid protein